MILRTALSAILSISAVFLGLMVFGVRARFAGWRLLLGGVITGLAVPISAVLMAPERQRPAPDEVLGQLRAEQVGRR